jgi:hypothetical protein
MDAAMRAGLKERPAAHQRSLAEGAPDLLFCNILLPDPTRICSRKSVHTSSPVTQNLR